MCTYYKVPLYFFGAKDSLGHAIGKEVRASLAVLDEGFAKAMVKQLETKQSNQEVVSMRVHELAKKLNRESKEIINLLKNKILK